MTLLHREPGSPGSHDPSVNAGERLPIGPAETDTMSPVTVPDRTMPSTAALGGVGIERPEPPESGGTPPVLPPGAPPATETRGKRIRPYHKVLAVAAAVGMVAAGIVMAVRSREDDSPGATARAAATAAATGETPSFRWNWPAANTDPNIKPNAPGHLDMNRKQPGDPGLLIDNERPPQWNGESLYLPTLHAQDDPNQTLNMFLQYVAALVTMPSGRDREAVMNAFTDNQTVMELINQRSAEFRERFQDQFPDWDASNPKAISMIIFDTGDFKPVTAGASTQGDHQRVQPVAGRTYARGWLQRPGTTTWQDAGERKIGEAFRVNGIHFEYDITGGVMKVVSMGFTYDERDDQDDQHSK